MTSCCRLEDAQIIAYSKEYRAVLGDCHLACRPNDDMEDDQEAATDSVRSYACVTCGGHVCLCVCPRLGLQACKKGQAYI